MKKNTEIELKMLISQENLEKLFALEQMQKVIRAGSKDVKRLRTSYFDTKEMTLQSYGIAYRVRDKGDGTFEATVKTSKKKTSGLSERLELNIPLQENKAVLTGFKAMGLNYELLDLVPQGVDCLFTVDVERTTYLLDIPNAVVEVAIDKGNVIAGDKKAPIDEIEFELKEGEASALISFTAELAEQVPLLMENRSKYARGLLLCNLPGSIPADVNTVEDAKTALARLKEQYKD